MLRAAPAVAESLAPAIAQIAQEAAYEGRIQLVPEAALKRADCIVEWPGGGAERAQAAIDAALEQLILRKSHDGADMTDREGAGNRG